MPSFISQSLFILKPFNFSLGIAVNVTTFLPLRNPACLCLNAERCLATSTGIFRFLPADALFLLGKGRPIRASLGGFNVPIRKTALA
jgi:hypothetical protein